MIWIVNGIGLALIVFIVWWFWLWKPKSTQAAGGAVDITVNDGVYDPGYIETKAGETLTLRFLRKDPSPCAEQVIFHDLDVSETLPVDKPKSISLTPKTPGTYRFSCQMNMYQGTLKVT
ncbi:cupredoxin domain-containing protein [Marinobacteraceae bacterium S3BR75-40.1]